MKRLLIIRGGILQLAVIKKAKGMGIYTIVVDGEAGAPGLPLADKSFVVDLLDRKVIKSIAVNEKIDGVIHPCSEIAMKTMGFINDEMKLSGIGLETAIQATNKEKMRRAFDNANAPSPRSKGASNAKEAIMISNEFSGDIIFKPSRNSGSYGITRLRRDRNEMNILEAFNRAIKNSHDYSVVIEEYIEGPEFSVEIVIWNNEPRIIAVTDKFTTGSPYFVEIGHSQPSQFPIEDLNEIQNAAIWGCKALHLNWCAAHAEIKLHKKKAFIIEIGARLAGDFISTELVHLSTGIDIVAAAINLALGIVPKLTKEHPSQGAAIRYFVPKPGKLLYLHINTQVINDPNIYQFEVYKKPGDHIQELKSSHDRSGHVITTGKNAKEAIRHSVWALNNYIDYETKSI